MRLRIVLITTVTIVVYITATLSWRQIFPFRDGIAQFLPKDTIAYVHANLTARVRRNLRFEISNLRFQDSVRAGLDEALRSPDVREIAVAWFQPEQHVPIVAVLVGQRASSRPDVVPATTVMVGTTELRIIVVRVRAGSSVAATAMPVLGDRTFLARRVWGLSGQPIQAFVRPRLLPIPALDAVMHLLPDTIVASGTMGRDGFALRSDGRSTWSLRSPRPTVVVTPRDGVIQLTGVPVRDLWKQLELPLHRDLALALDPILPNSADLSVDLSSPGAVLRLPLDPDVGRAATDALRALAARIWPSVRSGELVADPASIRAVLVGPGSWEVQRGSPPSSKTTDGQGPPSPKATEWQGPPSSKTTDGQGDVVAVVSVADGSAVIATRRILQEEALSAARPSIRLPRGCAIAGRHGQPVMITSRVHPQMDVALLMDRMGTTFTICGRSVR
ncbi:MAG: hypothetical protein Q7R80_02725 [bacterium]|nr:hypothetical protein [bacterium]